MFRTVQTPLVFCRILLDRLQMRGQLSTFNTIIQEVERKININKCGCYSLLHDVDVSGLHLFTYRVLRCIVTHRHIVMGKDT